MNFLIIYSLFVRLIYTLFVRYRLIYL